ncbi:MAG: epoxyqueuosine reductase [Synergistaceae bacterium]|nr:epoxyqueuosine reductase [Synergistaceae bacterium]
MSIFSELKSKLIDGGASHLGFADLANVNLSEEFSYPSGISIAVALRPEVLAGIIDNPTVDYEAEYELVNAKLDELSYMGEKFLKEAGYKAKAIPATTRTYDPVELSAPYQHKTTAIHAGLGWIGKLDILVTEQYGSGVRFATILTDLPPEEEDLKPIAASKCGACTSCADACPADASKRLNWETGMKREELVDIKACNKSIIERVKLLGIKHSICGICIVSCPWTRRYIDANIDSGR